MGGQGGGGLGGVWSGCMDGLQVIENYPMKTFRSVMYLDSLYTHKKNVVGEWGQPAEMCA